MKNKGKTLIYLQDPGGTNFIKSSLCIFKNDPNVMIASHKLSISLIESIGAHPSIKINDYMSLDDWGRFLSTNKITKCITTLSSKYIDMTNANLILALRKLKIPSLGFFDHWKGFDRLLENNELSYVTDKVCVIDDYVEKKLISLGVTKENIYKVGHPELELRLTNKNIKPIDPKGPKKICILSQPDTVNRNFESIFLTNKNPFFKNLIMGLKGRLSNFSIYLRHHPKEKRMSHIGVIKDELSWNDAINHYDLFIGLNSMTLFEAILNGKNCIALSPHGFNVDDGNLPYMLGKKCNDCNEVIEAIVNNNYEYDLEQYKKFCSMLIGSSSRLNSVLREF